MKKSQLATWLFAFYLGLTVILGFVLIILGPVFHISDTSAIMRLIIPTLLGQIAVLVKWLLDQQSQHNALDPVVRISKFVVFGPPILVTILVGATLWIKLIGFDRGYTWTPGQDQLQNLLTFCLAILNVTTILIVTVLFGANTGSGIPPAQGPNNQVGG